MSTTDALIVARERLEASRAAYLSAESWVRTCTRISDGSSLATARLNCAYGRVDDAAWAYESAEAQFYAATDAECVALEADLKSSAERRRIA